MMSGKGYRIAAVLVCAGLFMTPAFSAAGNDHEGKEHNHAHEHAGPAPAHGKGGNPLIEEMRILDGVFRDVVSAVSLGDGERVYHALHSMHGTMEKTHEGLHQGTVRITKNADKIETFVKMDRDFHVGLEKLAAAARKKDQKAMLTLTKGLLDGCAKCHTMFR